MTGERKKVLVVDDEPDAVAGITAMLETAGYETCCAEDGNVALGRTRRPGNAVHYRAYLRYLPGQPFDGFK